MAEVVEVTKTQGNFAHKVKVLKGQLQVGDTVTAAISVTNRNSIARNHTATHLLQKALREVVGEHVHQAGSSVTADGLRFDFSHYEAVSKEQLIEVEKIVNDKILHFLPVTTEEMSMKDASKQRCNCSVW